MLKTLLKLMSGRDRKYAVATPLLIAGEVIMETTIPLIMANLVDVGIMNSDIGYVFRMGALMVVMAMLSLVFGAGAARTASVSSAGFAASIRQALFFKIQDFSFSNIDRFSTSSLVTRMTTDVTNIQNSTMMVLRACVRAPLMFIMALVMSISINARLSVVFLFAIPIIGVMMFIVSKYAMPKFRLMLRKIDDLNRVIQENLAGVRVVKAFVREKHENDIFRDTTHDVWSAQLSAERLIIVNMPIMQMVVYACIVAILWFGGNMIIVGDMQTGQLTSFITYVTQILMSLMMVSMVFVMLVNSKASGDRIVEVLNEKIDITDENANEDLRLEDGSIKFDDVAFSYHNDIMNCAVRHINLDIKSGETVGIIGGTGSSKTSLVQLIPRLHDVIQGRVIVGGHDVREYKLDHLRGEVSMVLQKNVLFSGTILDNLRWGDENATDEEIIEACKDAQAHDFIMSFPDGYNTNLGQGGVNVSGGQKQRLCIARALLRKPKIIILDDSTSAVDTATDAKIRDAFARKLSDTTTIIIAQRISSIEHADKIVVMDNGRINGVGTHEELLRNNDIYREVYESQQKGAE
ncbi:MAG: ABC transporter ATP-binding protein/permease [Clostridiales bacterium]|nr:ABC transporter ATP-binding protein/permease [Clostridiales bacterium]